MQTIELETLLSKLEEVEKTFENTYHRPMTRQTRMEFEAMVRLIRKRVGNKAKRQAAD